MSVLVGVFVFGVVAIIVASIFHDLLYVRNQLMTDGERRFYKVLKLALPNTLAIFPQVRLASLVKPRGEFVWRNFRPLAIRSVDFVVCDYESGRTLLVIELDDKTHSFYRRRFRDKFIDRVLDGAGIPVLRIPYQSYYDSHKLASQVLSVVK